MAIEYALFVLAIGLFIALIVIWSLHFISLIYGKYKFHKKVKRLPTDKEQLPGVSIIKPLMGVDDNLVDNLETFFTMEYPNYEILFCVQDNTDQAINVVKHLTEKYPNVDAKLFTGGKNVGINPKINNMMQGYEKAKHDLILISDAGLKMANDTLLDMVCLMTEKVGLVHQMPFVCDRPGFAGSLEKVYFGTCHCRMYLFINLIGVNCVTGMSCLMRKNVIDQVGGLQKFGNYIAEDYFLAQTFLDNKWVIQLSHQPAMQNSASYSVPVWQKRMIRWCKLRLKLSIMSWLEPIQECFMIGLCTSWTVNYLFGWNSLVFFLIHVLAWFLCDYMLLKMTQNGKLPFTKFEFVVAWLYRETVCFYLFLKAASNPTVKWRDGKYRLKWGGLAEEIVSQSDAKNSIKTPNLSNVELGLTSSSLSSNSNNNINNKSININSTLPLTNSNNKIISSNLTATNSSKLLNNNNHKRTNSYSVMMNSNFANNANNSNNNNTNQYYSSDLENSPSIPLLSSNNNYNLNNKSINNLLQSSTQQQQGGNLTSTSPSSILPSSSINVLQQPQKVYTQIRSHHQHHHSISSPITSSSLSSSSTTAQTSAVTTTAPSAVSASSPISSSSSTNSSSTSFQQSFTNQNQSSINPTNLIEISDLKFN